MHVSLKEMFLKRGNSFIICFIILLLRNVLSDDNGRCIIYKEDGNEMSEDDWLNGIYLPAIDDNSSKKLLWSLKTKNIKKMQFQFNTNHNNYFNISLDPHSYYLSINLTDEFANYEEYESVDAVEIKISFQCSIEQKLVIIQPIMDFNNHNPEFLNAPYDFTIGMPILKNYSFDSHGIVIMARDIDISNKNVTFNIKSVNDETKGFYLLWSGQSIDDKNKPIFKARLITTELIDLHNDVTLKIFVQDTGKPVRNANTTISIRVNSARSTLKFSKSLYVADCRSAEVEKDVDIEFDNKILILRGAEADVSVDFVSNPTGYEEYFQHNIVNNMSLVSFKLRKPPNTLLEKSSILLELNVRKVGSLATTILLIKLPGTIDSILTPKLSFKKEFQKLEKDTFFTGSLMMAKAKLENANGDISYSIDNESMYEEVKITIDPNSGEVKVTKMISQGIYTFDIIAKVTEHKLLAKTKVLLVVTQKEMDYALRIIEVEEESNHNNILLLGSEFCSYIILSQTPAKDLFYIEKNTLNSRTIDRESIIFSNMSNAQVRLIIQVICPLTPDASHRVKRDTDYNVTLGNIPFVHSNMHIIAIITDINDNKPVWDSKIPRTIGYPAKELSQLILASCVYNLSATDADLGENATITYSTVENLAFYIHPNSGSLYVRLNVKVTDTVTVIAFDGVHSTSLNISLTLLKVNNVVALYLRNAVIEDIEDFLVKIQSNLTDYIIGVIEAGVINNFDTISKSTNNYLNNVNRNTLIRILIYGIDQRNSMPLSQANLIRVLNAGGISSFTDVLKISAFNEEEENNILLITTIVLGACLGFVIVGVATVIFYFKLRK